MEDEYVVIDQADEWTCMICYSLFEDGDIAVLSCCNNSFCKSCVIKLGKCPLCRAVIEKLNEPPRFIYSVLSKLRVQCIACQEVVNREDFNTHKKNDCVVDCEKGCGEKYSKKGIKEHDQVCKHVVVNCPAVDIGCGITMLRKDINEHLNGCRYHFQRETLTKIKDLESYIKKKDKIIKMSIKIQRKNEELEQNIKTLLEYREEDSKLIKKLQKKLEMLIVSKENEKKQFEILEFQVDKTRKDMNHLKKIDEKVDNFTKNITELETRVENSNKKQKETIIEEINNNNKKIVETMITQIEDNQISFKEQIAINTNKIQSLEDTLNKQKIKKKEEKIQKKEEIFKESQKIHIEFKTLQDKKELIELLKSDQISKLINTIKALIAPEKESTSYKEVAILHNNKQLSHSLSLDDCGLSEGNYRLVQKQNPAYKVSKLLVYEIIN